MTNIAFLSKVFFLEGMKIERKVIGDTSSSREGR